MKYLYAILIFDIALLCWANGQTNSVPPMPGQTHTNAIDAVEHTPVQHPTFIKRRVMKDGMATIRNDEIFWYAADPFWRVERLADLSDAAKGEAEWEVVTYTSLTNLTIDLSHDQSFYRVIRVKRPHPPNTKPNPADKTYLTAPTNDVVILIKETGRDLKGRFR